MKDRTAQIHNSVPKPKLVFFQYKYDQRLPRFLLIHKQEHVKCLSEFFDVTVIQSDCDYGQICDTYCPDLALFESGVNHETCQRLTIENVGAHPEVPKLGLHHADAFCNARAGFLSDMDHWGIETFFAISTTAAEHTPEIADNLFVWPVFIDPEVYRDYGVWKSIPVLLTGNKSAFYPWRQQVFRLLAERYPSLTLPHSGYSPSSGVANVVVGERYARTINASWCVPACGTIAKEAVRKHFEVPGSNACLVTERSAALEAAGFIDMQNCVFADRDDVLDKLAWLFANPDAHNAIIDAGHQLVHSRHTLKHRNQIFQWYNLHKTRGPDQEIVQLNPFDSPVLVERASGLRSAHVVSGGLHLVLLRRGDKKLFSGKYLEAEACYRECTNYMRWMPEPKLRMALCSLYKGNAKAALVWIEEPISFILAQYNAADPDPVEWAYLIVSLLCLGRLHSANKRAGQFPWLSHPELDRARWACNVLMNKERPLMPDDGVRQRRRSMHQLPERSTKEWLGELCIMLRACGQGDSAEALSECPFFESQSTRCGRMDAGIPRMTAGGQDRERIKNKSRGKHLTLFIRRVFVPRLELKCKQIASVFLHQMEARFGYFLPYYLSAMRNDEFFKAVTDLAREENMDAALVIGAAIGEGSTEAMLAGAEKNERRPAVFCIGGARRRWRREKIRSDRSSWIRWYTLSAHPCASVAQECGNTIERILADNRLTSFDAVLVNSDAFTDHLEASGSLMRELRKARLIFLDGTNLQTNYDIQRMLLRDATYVLIADNPGLRYGYAIFRKLSSEGNPISCHGVKTADPIDVGSG